MNYRSKDEKQQERIAKAMCDIARDNGDAMYCQLAEECGELVKAALKMVRVGNNDESVDIEKAINNLLEEMADVHVMLDVIETALLCVEYGHRITKIYHEKLNRFRSRVLPL